jgi:hypothetical protein
VVIEQALGGGGCGGCVHRRVSAWAKLELAEFCEIGVPTGGLYSLEVTTAPWKGWVTKWHGLRPLCARAVIEQALGGVGGVGCGGCVHRRAKYMGETRAWQNSARLG